MQKIDYKAKSLRELFITFNDCINSPYTLYRNQKKSEKFNFSMKIGASHASLSLDNTNINYKSTMFSDKTSFRIGFEIEYEMDFNNNKWAAFLEPSYQYFSSNGKQEPKTISINTPTRLFEIDYKSVEIPIGIRYYMYLNESSKIFLSAFYVPDFAMNSTIANENGREHDIIIENRAGFGLGFKLKNLYSAELRWVSDFNSDKSTSNSNITNYNYFSFILGYKIFKL